MIDHDVHWLAAFGQKIDRGTQEGLRTGSTDARQDHETGMDIMRSDQGAEIARVLRYEDEVPRYASGQDLVVRRTQSTEIARMRGEVNALGVQRFSDPRRQALIEEQAH